MGERTLAAHHRKELEEGSGISPGRIEERGYWTAADPAELLELGFSPTQAALVPALVLPTWGVDAEIVQHQIKPDEPRRNEDGKPMKYETPAGSAMRVDVGPNPGPDLADKRKPLWITEGIKKGDSAAVRGLCVVTLIGVWNWRGAGLGGGTVELADWEKINVKGRKVYIAFDSDVMRKPEVALALRRLAGMLRRRGATVVPIVPPGPEEGKTGLDDFFVRGGTLYDLERAMDMDLLTGREIVTNNRSLADMTADSLAAIAENNVPPQTFVRAGELARVVVDERGIPKIESLSPAALRGLLARCASFVRKTKDGGTEQSPPKDVVEDIMALGKWDLPAVAAITKAPILAPNGTLSEAPGYCPASKFYVASRETWPRWEGTAKEAADFLLNDVLFDFPFQGDADRAHALALMLLPILRPAIDGPTPLHLIDAPVQGTGKSLLAKACLMPTMGANISATPGTRDEEEWRKKIASCLLEGKAYLFLDNLSRKVDSDSLAGALTSTEWNDRALSTMRNINVPVRCVWLATTNNAELSRDILRRTVWIRLDARVERPEDRKGFRHPDIENWIVENRPRVVSALCAMVRAWVESGRPAWSGRRLGSFEEWSRVVGGVLEVAGVPGFLGNLDELRVTASSEEAAWAELYSKWYLYMQGQAVKASSLVSYAKEDDELSAMLGDKGESSQKARMGHLLKRRVGVVCGGFRVERAGERAGSVSYRLTKVEEQNPTIENTNPTTNPTTDLNLAETNPTTDLNLMEGFGGVLNSSSHTHTHMRAHEGGLLQTPTTPPLGSNQPNKPHHQNPTIGEDEVEL